MYQNLNQARGFYGTIIVAVIVGLLLNFSPIEPFRMLFYAAVINGIVAPPLMILLMLISSNKDIMRNHVNPPLTNILGWMITAIMSFAAIALVVGLLLG